MADFLEKYSDTENAVNSPAKKTPCDYKLESRLKKKDLKNLKRLTKAIRQHNKLLAQEAERRKAEEAVAAEAARLKAEEEAKEADKRKSGRGVRGFLTKLGDAICRAVPKVLTTLATLAFSWFVKNKLDRRVPQAA